MGHPAVSIPEKIFFKIGEVCDIVDVQAHVLRYWETEFPQLSPQKNRSGQRSYRRRDVEIALRIKELLYVDEYTIAGARKKLQTEIRESSRLKIVPVESSRADSFIQPVAIPAAPIDEPEELDEFAMDIDEHESAVLMQSQPQPVNGDRRQALTELASQLLELRELLKTRKSDPTSFFQRKY